MNGNWDRLAAQLAGPSRVVNLVGPLGVGKTFLLRRVLDEHPDIIVLDDVDAPSAVARAAQAVAQDARFVIASRRRLSAWPGWQTEVTTVPAHAWPQEAIARLAGQDELAARLSGGLPLVAEGIRLSVADGVEAEGAVAATLAREIVKRLEREGADASIHEPLTVLAIAGAADEEMLRQLAPVPSGGFEVLAGLSIVRRDAVGLTMAEPYRTILDLGLGWHRPLHRRTLTAKGLVHRGRQIALLPGNGDLGRIMDRSLMLLDDPTVRETLFPATTADMSVRPATADDFEQLFPLTRRWACRSGMHERLSERILHGWWDYDPSGFRVAVTSAGTIQGLYHVLPAAADAADEIEPLLQQHLPDVIGPGRGLVLGLAFSDDPAPGTLATLLRHAVCAAAQSGGLVVSTQWPPYQRLTVTMGLTHLGYTREDLCRCGRPNGVYSLDLTPDGAYAWLQRLSNTMPAASPDRCWDEAVRQALKHLREPARLAASPLVALPAVGSAQRLCASLRQAVEMLAASGDPIDAEAGRLLSDHYLRQVEHAVALRQASMSRATYFRRLNHGISRISELLRVTKIAA